MAQCHELWYRMVTVALIQPPSLGTSICGRCNPKRQKKKEGKKGRKEGRKEGRKMTKSFWAEQRVRLNLQRQRLGSRTSWCQHLLLLSPAFGLHLCLVQRQELRTTVGKGNCAPTLEVAPVPEVFTKTGD